MPNSIPMSWLHILTICIRVSIFFSIFANILMSLMYIRWFIFSCNLLSLYPAVHFLSMCLRSIMVIMNFKGDSASPWKIPLWILFQPIFFLLMSIQLSRFSWFSRWSLEVHVIFCTFWDSLLPSFAEPYQVPFWSQSRPWLGFFVWSSFPLGCVDLCKLSLLCLWILCGILSVL